MKSKGNLVEERDKIMENLDLGKSSGYSDMASNRKIDKENFITHSGDVSGNHEDMWRPGLKLHDEEQTTLHSGPNHGYQHQIYVIINDTSEEFDGEKTQLSTRKT
jgi:hypothetical protein